MTVISIEVPKGATPSKTCGGCRGAAYSPPFTSLMFRRGRVICASCRLSDLECACEYTPTLFDPTPPIDPVSIEAAFRRFHRDNPHVYGHLARLAREAKRAGLVKIGIATIWERLRWHYQIETTGDALHLNNNYRSRYARLLMDLEDDLEEFFETRALSAA